jgi:hypothetical protein
MGLTLFQWLLFQWLLFHFNRSDRTQPQSQAKPLISDRLSLPGLVHGLLLPERSLQMPPTNLQIDHALKSRKQFQQ